MNSLAKEHLESPTTVKSSLNEQQITPLTQQLPEWNLHMVDGIQRLERSYSFGNFMDAFNFAARISSQQDQSRE